MSGKRPTHNLVLMPKQRGPLRGGSTMTGSSTVGVAWAGISRIGKPYFSIRLNVGVVLDWRMADTLNMALFERPSNDDSEEQGRRAPEPEPPEDDDIPF